MNVTIFMMLWQSKRHIITSYPLFCIPESSSVQSKLHTQHIHISFPFSLLPPPFEVLYTKIPAKRIKALIEKFGKKSFVTSLVRPNINMCLFVSCIFSDLEKNWSTEMGPTHYVDNLRWLKTSVFTVVSLIGILTGFERCLHTLEGHWK